MVIKASDFESYNNEFTLNVQMNFQSLVGILNEKGYMRLRDGENYDASLRDSNNAEYALEDHRIMVLNSTDLQITYKDAQEKFNSLTFRKKK
jgi:hypothetical protein